MNENNESPAKVILSQGFYLNRRIQNLQDELAYLRTLTDIGSPKLDAVGGSPGNNWSGTNAQMRNMDSIVDIEREIEAEMRNLIRTAKTIRETIHSVENPQAQIVLTMRYLFDKSWPEIADDLCLSLKQVRRIHAAALEELDEKMPKTETLSKNDTKCP